MYGYIKSERMVETCMHVCMGCIEDVALERRQVVVHCPLQSVSRHILVACQSSWP
jgi:hypothetical protein